MKKHKKLIIVVLCLIFAGGTFGTVCALNDTFFGQLMIFLEAHTWGSIVDDFDTYAQDFQTVADFCRDYVETNEPESAKVDGCKIMLGHEYPDGPDYLFIYRDSGPETLSLPEDIQESLTIIKTAFPDADAPLVDIRYYDGRIAFEGKNWQYSLVYSFDDVPPTFVSKPDERGTMRVRKIRDHWYHAVIEAGSREADVIIGTHHLNGPH